VLYKPPRFQTFLPFSIFSPEQETSEKKKRSIMSGSDITLTAHAERGQDQITDQNVINNYFIGPRASNLPDFRANINTVLDELLETRLDYYPEDNVLLSLPF
jgi:hypothetical protein